MREESMRAKAHCSYNLNTCHQAQGATRAAHIVNIARFLCDGDSLPEALLLEELGFRERVSSGCFPAGMLHGMPERYSDLHIAKNLVRRPRKHVHADLLLVLFDHGIKLVSTRLQVKVGELPAKGE